MEIKNFEEFINPILKDGQKFVSYQCKNLLGKGENYGSILLKVQVKILNEKGEEETMDFVAKTCPPPGFLREAFNVNMTFKKEIAAYNSMVPALNEFGREKGIERLIDFVPEFIAARISLDHQSDQVDENAVLLLENLLVKGYEVGDRFVGFDLDTAKLVLSDLATLHASVIAFKKAKPDEFKTKFLPYLVNEITFTPDEKLVRDSVEVMLEAVALNHKCVPHLSKIRQLVEHMNRRRANVKTVKQINETFGTLGHNDYWLNNTLVKYVKGVPIKNKMIDFQNMEYLSLGHDVLFFMYSSVALPVLEEHADDLIKIYYGKFIQILTKLQCDIAPYTYEAVMQELGVAARVEEFSHVLFMLSPIMMLKNKAKDLADVSPADFTKDRRSYHENFSARLQFVLLDFVKRGWV